MAAALSLTCTAPVDAALFALTPRDRDEAVRAGRRSVIEEQWGANTTATIGDNGPASAAWGHCDRDYPREGIVSPYPFKTAQEHYEALQAETIKRGGAKQHPTAEQLADWTGRYMHPGNTTDAQADWTGATRARIRSRTGTARGTTR